MKAKNHNNYKLVFQHVQYESYQLCNPFMHSLVNNPILHQLNKNTANGTKYARQNFSWPLTNDIKKE
jgi:hypothetical protein